MSNVFLPGLNNEHRTRLAEAQVPCYDLTLGEDYGLMVEQQHLDAALAALNAYIETQAPSDFEGIAVAVLKPKVATAPVEPKNHKVTDDWKGGDNDELVQSVRHFLVPLIDRDVQLHTRSGYPCEPIEDGKFHIHLYCSTQKWTEPGTVPPATLFGYPNSNQTRTFLPPGRGIPIADEASGFVVAELIGANNLYVLWNLQHNYEPNRGRIFRVLMQKLAHVLGMPADEHRKLMRQRFVEECSKAMVRVIRDTARDAGDEVDTAAPSQVVPSRLMPNSRFGTHIPSLIPAAGANAISLGERKSRIQELRKQLTGSIAAARAKERKLLTDESVDLEEFGLEYEDLMKVKGVKDVKVERDTIVILTDVLNCRDERTNLYHEIGAFKIELPMNSNQPRWTNLTRRVSGMKEGMHAPHVWDTGHACLGNTSDIFPKLFAQRQWSIAAQLAIEFVQSANTADAAGKHVNRWPRAVGR